MAIASIEEILALAVDKMPKDQVTIDGNLTLEVQALSGADRLRISSIDYLDERVLFALPIAVVKPKMDAEQALKFMDGNPRGAVKVLTKILDLSGALGDAEAKTAKDAEKN
jgi:hypothetical protein